MEGKKVKTEKLMMKAHKIPLLLHLLGNKFSWKISMIGINCTSLTIHSQDKMCGCSF